MLSEIRKVLFLSVVSTGQLLTVSAQGACSLCATPADFPPDDRWGYRLPNGQTCQDVYIDLNFVDNPDSNDCKMPKRLYQNTCCSEEEPDPIEFPPTAAPVYNGPVGDQPDCRICGTEEYPGIPSAFIVARYVGDYTCDQLYHRGLHGLIPFFMCGPLQDFAEPVCGCGRYNPACQRDPTKCHGYVSPGNPAPVPAPTAPNPPPQPLPTQAPVRGPYDRKIPPQNYKTNAKLGGSSGGAAGRLRGGRDLQVLENDSDIPEIRAKELNEGQKPLFVEGRIGD